MPVTKRYPIAELMQACRRYREKTRRRVFIEYLLLAGVNDSSQQARQLVALLAQGRPGRVPRQPDRLQPDRHRVRRGRRRRACGASAASWRRAAIGTSYRVSRGRGIEAACGQLVMQGIPPRRRAS